MSTIAEIRHGLFEEFSARLAAVLETMVGERPGVEIEELGDVPADAVLLWKQPFSGISGAVWVAAEKAGWTTVGGQVLKAAGIEENDAASLKSTYLETVSQALSGLAGTMGASLGREVNLAGGEESSAPGADTRWAEMKIHFHAESATLALGLEAALADALASAPRGDPALTMEEAAAAATGGITGPVNSKTFELLLDVELPVSVSFGRAQVALKDVLKLTTGSIVELNRSVLEPVEVIVNNCVIARGEVVVVEGNFGVRVHQVVSHQERLRTLN